MAKPTSRLRSDLENLPDRIRNSNRFLLWRSEKDAKGKIRKTPYYASGRKRYGDLDTAGDLRRLVTLDEAIDAAVASGDYSGIGFALVEGDGFGSFDMDKCLTADGEIVKDFPGRDIIEAAQAEGAYIEVSPSGKGLRILGASKVDQAYSKEGVEYWAKGRYVTVTGSPWANPKGWTSIQSHREALGIIDPKEKKDFGDDVLVTPRTVAELKSALDFIDSDERDTWVRIGLALKTAGQKGLDMWLEWSAESDKFDRDDALRVWDSMRPQSTDFRAVFAEAQREGWQNPRKKGNRQEKDEDAEPVSLPVGLGEYRLQPTEFVVDGYIPAGLTMIAGAWGAGKSTNLIPVLVAVAHCDPLDDWDLRPELRRKVVLLTEAPGQAHDTLYSIFQGDEGVAKPNRTAKEAFEEGQDTPERVGKADDYGPKSGRRGGLTKGSGQKALKSAKNEAWADLKNWFFVERAARLDPEALVTRLEELVEQHSYDLELDDGGTFRVHPVLVLDTVSANIDLENESDNSEVGYALNTLKASLPGVPVILVGHTTKVGAKGGLGEMSFRGAGAWEAEAEATFYMVYDEELDVRFMASRKVRFKPSFTEISFGAAGGSESVDTPWGTTQLKHFAHGVPCRSNGDERKQKQRELAEAKQEQKQRRSITDRQTDVIEVVRQRTKGRILTRRVNVVQDTGGNQKMVFEAINRLVEAKLLTEHTCPDWFDFPGKRKSAPPTVLVPQDVDPVEFFEAARVARQEAEE